MSIIELENINFQYKGSKDGSLCNVNLNVEEGQTVLLCGASGSGKTTIIRIINGLMPDTQCYRCENLNKQIKNLEH